MGESVAYAKAVTKLLEALKTCANEAALKAAVVRVRGHARSRALELVLTDDGALTVDGVPRDAVLFELCALEQCMRDHNIGRLTMLEGAVAKELLHLAVLMSKPSPASEREPTIFDFARDLSLWSIRLVPAHLGKSASAESAQAAEFNALPVAEVMVRADEFVATVSSAAAENDAPSALAALSLLFVAESLAPDCDRKGAWTSAFDKAATPAAIQLVAQLLPETGIETGVLRGILKRAGDVGAEALISLLPTADSLVKRRVYFDAIVELRRGVPMLLDALKAPQWYVIRNAALLLGEMKVRESENALSRLLTHHDERVRVAATSALAQIDTASSRALVQSAIQDASPEVRRRAAGAFGAENGTDVSALPLLRALAVEKSLEVEVEILHALGRVASADAVRKLIQLCSQSGAANKPASFRIAAIEALTMARRSSALSILRTMSSDSEPAVRATARNLIESVNAMAGAR